MSRYWYKNCAACGQGRLFVMKRQGEANLFLLCEECESAWQALEDVGDTHKSVAIPVLDFDFANVVDITRAGWNPASMSEANP